MKTKRDMLASALIVLSIAIKPYGALLLPVVLVRRQRAAIVATAVGCLLLLLLPVPLYGWSGGSAFIQSWWATVTETTAPNLLIPITCRWRRCTANGSGSVVSDCAGGGVFTGPAGRRDDGVPAASVRCIPGRTRGACCSC